MTDQFIIRMKIYDRIMRPMVRYNMVDMIVPPDHIAKSCQWTPDYRLNDAQVSRLEQRG